MFRYKRRDFEDTSPVFNLHTGKPMPNTAPYHIDGAADGVTIFTKKISVLDLVADSLEPTEIIDFESATSMQKPETERTGYPSRRNGSRRAAIAPRSVRKRYACKVCFKKFTRASQVRKHLFNDHFIQDTIENLFHRATYEGETTLSEDALDGNRGNTDKKSGDLKVHETHSKQFPVKRIIKKRAGRYKTHQN